MLAPASTPMDRGGMGILIQGGNLFTASLFGTWREVPREAVSDPSSTASSCSSGAAGPGPVTGDL